MLQGPWGLVTGAFGVLAGITCVLWIASILGAPTSAINAAFLLLSIPGYALVGLMCRTANSQEYYVAARRIAAPFNGMATAADWMSAASFIGLTGILFTVGFNGDGIRPGGLAYVLGWTGGFCILGLLFAARINRFPGATIPDLLAHRFDSHVVRWLSALGAILCSGVYLIAQIYAIGLVASMLSGLSFELGVFLALGGILMCSFLGGMRAVTWTQVVQCVVIVVTIVGVTMAVAVKLHGHPLVPLAGAQSLRQVEVLAKDIAADPRERAVLTEIERQTRLLDAKIASPAKAREDIRADLSAALTRLKNENAPQREIQRLQTALNAAAAEPDVLALQWMREREQLTARLTRPAGMGGPSGDPKPTAGLVNTLALVFCLMVGTAALPHVLVRSYTARSPAAARTSIAWALIFIVAVYLCASALAVMVKSVVLSELVGAHIDQLPEWASRLRLRKLALLSIHDLNGDGIVQFAEIHLVTDYLVLAVPDIIRIPPVLTGLIAAGALAAALSTADGLLLTISNALVHDLYIQSMAPQTQPTVRVTLSKLMLLVVALLAAWAAANRGVDILFLVASAFSLAASTFFPVLCLGLYWKRMNAAGAICAMVVGLGLTLYYILVHHPWVRMRLDLPDVATYWWGIDPVSAGVFGVPAGFVVGIVVSLATRAWMNIRADGSTVKSDRA